MTVDVQELSRLLSERLGARNVRLSPLDVRCAWPVFKATTGTGDTLFVKVVDRPAAERTLAFLAAVPTLSLFPRPRLTQPVEFAGCAVLCLEWRTVQSVNAEDMSDAQLASFAAGCRRLSEGIRSYAGPVVPPEEDDPERQYAALADYAARHPVVRRFLRPLLSLPPDLRRYGRRTLSVIHGDLQPRNYGFDGDRFAAVFDFDALTRGLPCEDAAYAFTERARRSELSQGARRRLTELFLRLVKESPWPGDEWRIALGHARLRIAARRLESHPRSPFTAFDIARRDRPLARLAAALEEDHA